MFDTIVRGGSIVDGRGGAPYVADIGITDGRIAANGNLPEPSSPANRRSPTTRPSAPYPAA